MPTQTVAGSLRKAKAKNERTWVHDIAEALNYPISELSPASSTSIIWDKSVSQCSSTLNSIFYFLQKCIPPDAGETALGLLRSVIGFLTLIKEC